MFKVIFQTEQSAAADSKPFPRLPEAMNFVANVVARHGSAILSVNVVDEQDGIVFEHGELMRACAQVRT